MDWLETHQNLVVGIFGFIGVISTIWANAYIARKQRREEREHEQRTVRSALLAELQINMDSLKTNARTLTEKPPLETGAVFVPTDPMDGAFRSFLPKIGLLSEDEVNKVMNAYMSLQTYNTNLGLIGSPGHTIPRGVSVPARHATTLRGLQESMLKPVEEAVRALEARRRT